MSPPDPHLISNACTVKPSLQRAFDQAAQPAKSSKAGFLPFGFTGTKIRWPLPTITLEMPLLASWSPWEVCRTVGPLVHGSRSAWGCCPRPIDRAAWSREEIDAVSCDPSLHQSVAAGVGRRDSPWAQWSQEQLSIGWGARHRLPETVKCLGNCFGFSSKLFPERPLRANPEEGTRLSVPLCWVRQFLMGSDLEPSFAPVCLTEPSLGSAASTLRMVSGMLRTWSEHKEPCDVDWETTWFEPPNWWVAKP